ncbi:MAG TPA: hypothetical protein VIJ16_05985, partial [Gemmatimonadaceae bacterium]
NTSDLSNAAMTNAYRYRDRLPDRERYATIGSYFGNAGPGNDRGKAIDAYRQGVALGDYEVSGHNLAVLLESRRQLAAAESAYAASTVHTHFPSIATYQQLGLTLVTMNRVDAADSVANAYEQKRGVAAPIEFVKIAGLYQRGLADSSRTRALELDTVSNPAGRSQLTNFAAQVDEREGKLSSALGRMLRANGIDRARGAFVPVLADSGQKAFFDAWFRDRDQQAVHTLDAALAAQPLRSFPADQAPYPQIATLYAMAGRADRARAVLAEMDAAYAHDPSLRAAMRPQQQRALGYVELAENHPLDALKNFRASDSLSDGPADDCPACTAFVLGLAFDRANQPDSAIAEYQRFITVPGGPTSQREGDDLALVYKSLGRLYDAKGNVGEAANYYSKFVDLWKNADADLQPQVAEVKLRLAHLRDTEKHQ